MDVYGKWIDECEKQNEGEDDESSEEEVRLGLSFATVSLAFPCVFAHFFLGFPWVSGQEDEDFELSHNKKAGGGAEEEESGKARAARLNAEAADSDLSDDDLDAPIARG